MRKDLDEAVTEATNDYNQYLALYQAAIATSSTRDDEALARSGLDLTQGPNDPNYQAVKDILDIITRTGEIPKNETKKEVKDQAETA